MAEDFESRQKMQEEMQRSAGFVDIFSKIVSGKAGYKTVVTVKNINVKCKGCGLELDSRQKFCHECGTKVELSAEEKK